MPNTCMGVTLMNTRFFWQTVSVIYFSDAAGLRIWASWDIFLPEGTAAISMFSLYYFNKVTSDFTCHQSPTSFHGDLCI